MGLLRNRTRTMRGTIARKGETPDFRCARVTHSSPPIVLELELVVLDPSVEFLLKSSRVRPVGCS
jgi:hypothetical protein